MTGGAIAKLAAWLASAMLAWTSNDHRPEHRETVERAAVEIARVVASEPPVFAGRDGAARTALLLASIGSLESGWREDVQAGKCRPGECDHGLAKCWMQVHPDAGLVLLRDGGYDYLARRTKFVDGDRVVRAEDLLDEETCLRAALHMARASIQRTGGLREYTGEKIGADAKARTRLERARAWLRAHPPPAG